MAKMMKRVGMIVAGVLLLFTQNAWAAGPAPSNLRQTGVFAGQPVLGWDAPAAVVSYYRVLVDGSQAYRPRVPSVKVDDLVKYCHVLRGHTYSISVQAVDPTGARSETSESLQVTVA
ncbi:fibronectin type III domain-containing protein [Actinocrispum sp. NPDC049592]|uniref:fibronectin type III domain-containing protein n=1 Tax=Actinocrispum sp. NPDC049592 TaxID=3154835 RepID=UPI003435B152